MSEIYIENQTNNPLVTAELVAAFMPTHYQPSSDVDSKQ